jgi:hypothetical protein
MQARIAHLEADIACARKEAIGAGEQANALREQLDDARAAEEKRADAILAAETERSDALLREATAIADLAAMRERYEEKIALVQKLSESLHLQKETVETMKNLSFGREAAMRRDMDAAHRRLKELESVQAQGDDSQQEALRRVQEMLAKEAARADLYERANVEMCAQLRELTAERRAAQAQEAKATVAPQVAMQEQAEEKKEIVAPCRRRGRPGAPWVAVVSCALGILWVAEIALTRALQHGGKRR